MLKNGPITVALLLTAGWLLSTGAAAGADAETKPEAASATAKKPTPKRTGQGRAAEKAEPAAADPEDPRKAPKAAGREGVKTYEFEAVEVEGRMKAPQVIYFLRRVRKEFRAGMLGHRSFLLELSDTRRHRALR